MKTTEGTFTIEYTERQEGKERRIEAEVDLEAPVEAVWSALTEAEELESWFPFEAKVEPGVGGSVALIWDEEVRTEMPIEIWEPGKHLRTLWIVRQGDASRERVQAAVDYFLEGHAGGTRLRLVHSGFSADADWGDTFDGFFRGWSYELRSLQHYLGRHRGRRRGMVRVEAVAGTSEEEAWQRLFSRRGLFREGGVDCLSDGESYRLEAASGEELAGEVRLVIPHTDFAATVESLEGSLLRVKIGLKGTRPLMVNLWLACWRLDDKRIRAIQRGWQQMLDGLFAA